VPSCSIGEPFADNVFLQRLERGTKHHQSIDIVACLGHDGCEVAHVVSGLDIRPASFLEKAIFAPPADDAQFRPGALKLPATILLNSSVCYHYPQIVEKIPGMHRDHRKYLVVRPTGWLGPAALESNVTPDLLKEAGYTHLLDLAARRPADLDANARRTAAFSPIRWN
jgi:hypothetical protein